MSYNGLFENRFKSWLGNEPKNDCLPFYGSMLDARSVLETSYIAESKDEYKAVEGEFSIKAHDLWRRYLCIIEDHLDDFRVTEGMSRVEFKHAIENMPNSNNFLIRLMIASWSLMPLYRYVVILSCRMKMPTTVGTR